MVSDFLPPQRWLDVADSVLCFSAWCRVEPGVETAFLGTRSGLLRIMRYAGAEVRVAK